MTDDAGSGMTVCRRALAVAVMAGALAGLTAVDPALAVAEDKALGRPASASSVEGPRNGGACNVPGTCTPDKANDGRPGTRWSSEYADGEWWQVDLGRPRLVDTVALTWEPCYASRYRISTSLDGATFTTAADQSLNPSPVAAAVLQVTRRLGQTTSFAARSARYVRVTGLERGGTRLCISLWDASVFGPEDVTAGGASGPLTAPPATAPASAGSGGGGGSTTSSGAGGGGTTSGSFTSTGSRPASAAPETSGDPRESASGTPLRYLLPFPTVRIRGTLRRSGVSIDLLSVQAPRRATVRAACRGRGCPRVVRRRRGGSQRLRELQRTLRSGAVIEIFVTQAGTYGKYTRFEIRRGKPPRRTDRCALHGATRPITCPEG